MVPSPERWIERARQYAEAVCRGKPGWDAGDLEGSIIEQCVRWPPQNEDDLQRRCRWATAGWFRANLGRNTTKMFAHEQQPIEFEDGTNQLDLQADPSDLIGDLISEVALLQIRVRLPPSCRCSTWPSMRWLPSEISAVMGYSPSRASQHLMGIRSKLQALLIVAGDDGGGTGNRRRRGGGRG